MPWQSIHHQHGPSFGIDGSEDTLSFDAICCIECSMRGLKSGVGKQPCRSFVYLYFNLQRNRPHLPNFPVHILVAFSSKKGGRLQAYSWMKGGISRLKIGAITRKNGFFVIREWSVMPRIIIWGTAEILREIILNPVLSRTQLPPSLSLCSYYFILLNNYRSPLRLWTEQARRSDTKTQLPSGRWPATPEPGAETLWSSTNRVQVEIIYHPGMSFRILAEFTFRMITLL